MRVFSICVCSALLAVMCSISGFAQNTTGSIVGVVKDASGAVVPNAKVQVKDVNRGQVRVTMTNSTGEYAFSLLQPGTYSISVTSSGFKTVERPNVVLQVQQTVRSDFALAVGNVSQTIQVSGHPVALNTDDSTVGQVVANRQIEDLPLNGRRWIDLMFISSGAVETGGEQSTFRFNAGSAISIGGARNSSNGYTVDGTSLMDTGYNTPAYEISLDAIQEFKIMTKTYPAQYGYSLNQVNLVTKSGTNDFHGSLYEYLRNNALDARDFFNKPPSPVNPLRQNQFGYSLGGPVIIPKLYNGRNRTFFFANYEGLRVREQVTRQGNVPTAAELQGQFPFPITDPLTGQLFPQQGGVYVIPANRISRLGQIIQSDPKEFFPLPNSQGAFNFVGPVAGPVNDDQQNYRIDQTFGTKNSFFFRAGISNVHAETVGGLTASSNEYWVQPTRNYTGSYTHVFGPTLVNQFRYGYLSAVADQNPLVISPTDLQKLALQNTFQEPNMGFPGIGFTPYPLPNATTAYTGTGSNGLTPLGSNQSMNDFSDSLSWTKGKHLIEAGFDLRAWVLAVAASNRPLGGLTFDGQFSGNQISDMLLGNPTNYAANTAGPLGNVKTGINPRFHFMDWAPYIEDDWKATKRLTLNLGLRYEYTASPYEEHNQFFWFDPTIPGGGLGVANKTVADTYGGGLYRYNGRRGPGPTPKNVFAPRFGFAFRPFGGDNTVVRGGFGLYFDTEQLNEYFASGSQYPYGAEQRGFASILTHTLISTDNLYPPLGTGPVTAADLSFLEVQPSRIWDPYATEWSFDVQRELFRNTLLDVAYTGNKGTHLQNRGNPNQPTQCDAAHNCDPLAQTPATIAARLPYPNLGILVSSANDGYSNYDALDVKVQHRGTNLMLLADYTWSKAMDIKSSPSGLTGSLAGWAGVMDYHDTARDYAPSAYDDGQRLALSFVYSLPVGHGKAVLSNASTLVNGVLGGWQVAGIGIFQGGFPFSIGATDLGFINEAFGQRADLVGNPYPAGFHKTPTEWFNTAAFAQPAPGEFGTSGRNIIRMPGVNNWNLSLSKDFHLSEKATLEFRIDSFNLLNHPEFSVPNAGVNSATFGVISLTNSLYPARINQVSLRIEF